LKTRRPFFGSAIATVFSSGTSTTTSFGIVFIGRFPRSLPSGVIVSLPSSSFAILKATLL